MENGRAALQADRLSNVLDGDFVLAGLGRNHAEKMNGVRVIRDNVENLPVNPLRSLQMTDLMLLQATVKASGIVAIQLQNESEGKTSRTADYFSAAEADNLSASLMRFLGSRAPGL